MSDYSVIFFGTPEYAATTMKTLVASGVPVVAAVTPPDSPIGRTQFLAASPVKIAANLLNIPVFQPRGQADFATVLKKITPSVGVLFAFGNILPSAFLKAFSYGVLNIHPSLLPKYRGPSPVQQAILDGADRTGVSVIRLDEQVDHGPILAQVETKIEKNERLIDLIARLASVGTRELIRVLPLYISGTLKLIPQRHEEATYTKPFSRTDGQIDWATPAEQVYRQYRACYPWPGIYTAFGQKRLKIHDLSVLNAQTHSRPGEVLLLNEKIIAIACGSGAVQLITVQLEGSKPMTAGDFLRGHPAFYGAILR